MYCGIYDPELYKAIENGIQLPKGHKRLIEDNFEVGPIFDKEGNRIGYQYVTQEDLNNALTIIEADKDKTDEIGTSIIKLFDQDSIIDKITEIVEPLRHLSFDEMSDIERQMLRVIDKYNERRSEE